METQTRIGVGATALFAIAGFAALFVRLSIVGPVIAGCFAVSVWGLWPLIKKRNLFSKFRWRILIHEAAREAYEAAERANALQYAVSVGASPLAQLKVFKYVFLVDDEVVLYGVKRPSTISRPIPREEYRELHPSEENSDLKYITPKNSIAYVDVTISRRDLRRIKKQWPAEAKAWASQFKR